METVRGYLFRIARNVFLHHRRRAVRQQPLEEDTPEAATALRDLEVRDELRDTMRALQELPEIDRAAVLLRAEEDLSYEEIARVLDLSLSAVKVKIHRARLKLALGRKENIICK